MAYFIFKRSLFLLGMVLLSGTVSAQYLYRYKDENGVTVMRNSIEAQYVSAGYEVLDSRTGQVIERISPVVTSSAGNVSIYLTPEDRILLSSYSSTEEINEHLERKLEKLDAEVANIRTDIRVLGLELEKEMTELTRLQEREREIPEELTTHIAELEASLTGLNDALVRREYDRNQTTDEYEGKVSRFQALQAADELR